MKEKILRLLELCMNVNDQTEHEVDFNMSGIAASCGVCVYLGGWSSGHRADYHFTFYYDSMFDSVEYDAIIQKLEELLK